MGWFIVNILLPMFAPLLGLLLFLPFPLPEKNAALVTWTSPIKDGQLAWAGLAFSAAAIYELENGALASSPIAKWILGALVALVLVNGMVAALGGVFPTEGKPPADKSPWRFYKAMTASAVLTVLAGGALTAVHFLSEGGPK